MCFLMVGLEHKTAVARLRTLRRKDRVDAFQDARGLHDRHARASGHACIGRDEHGDLHETRELTNARVVVDQWYVTMSFKKEDSDKLKGKSSQEIETLLRKGDVPRKPQTYTTHIIRAVRALKHLRQSYEKEITRTDKIIDLLAEDNISLARGNVTDDDIDAAIGVLNSVDEFSLKSKRVAVKRIVAREKLAKTIEMLETAKTVSEDKRRFVVNSACAVFTALRNRLGQWRDRQIAGIVKFNRLREYALRAERDNWLYAKLTQFAEIPERISKYCEIDAEKIKVLERIKEMIKSKVSNDEILGFITKNSPLFRVVERKRQGAELQIVRMEIGYPASPESHYDYLIGHYAWLYRFVNQDDMTKALAKVDYLLLFVHANKPRFILDELKKDDNPDSYLSSVITHMETSVQAFEQKDFETAKLHFAYAARALPNSMRPRG